jgi:hypothetical protein
MLVEVFRTADADPHVIARLESSLRRVFASMGDADRGDVEKSLQCAADAAGAGSVLLALTTAPAPVPHPAVLELARGDVERSGDEELDALVARVLRERVARLDSILDQRGHTQREAVNGMAAVASRLARIIFD